MQGLERVISGVEAAFCSELAGMSGLPIIPGKLKLRAKLGEGACSVVYKAYMEHGQKVAVKVYRHDCMHVCRMEANLLVSYAHSNIVSVLGIATDVQRGSSCSLVMEYMNGGSMFGLIAKQMLAPSSLLYSNEQATIWAEQIASALEFLHSHSPTIAHRDIKQENVLLKKQHGQTVAKLIDFSLTTELSEDKLVPDSGGLPCGPPSSQQQRGSKPPLSGHPQLLRSKSARSTNSSISALHSSEPTDERSSSSNAMATSSSSGHTGYSSSMLMSTTSHTSNGGSTTGSSAKGKHKRNSSISSSHQTVSAAVGVNTLECTYLGDMGAVHTLGQPADSLEGEEGEVGYKDWWTTGTPGGGSPTSMDLTAELGMGKGKGKVCQCAPSEVSVGSSTASFNLTGQTGSYTYMAPEVFLNQPYNEKSDVFSFGVLIYEIFSRQLLVCTLTRNNSAADIERYARQVAKGFRPPQSKKVPEKIWNLIQMCWDQDPMQRPTMSDVRSVLSSALKESGLSTTSQNGGRHVGNFDAFDIMETTDTDIDTRHFNGCVGIMPEMHNVFTPRSRVKSPTAPTPTGQPASDPFDDQDERPVGDTKISKYFSGCGLVGEAPSTPTTPSASAPPCTIM